MLTEIRQSLQSLEALQVNTSNWDPIIVRLATKNLDRSSLVEWEKIRPSKELATKEDIFEFIKRRIRVLESLETSRSYEDKKCNLKELDQKPKFYSRRFKNNFETEDLKTTTTKRKNPPTICFTQTGKKSKFQNSKNDSYQNKRACAYCVGPHKLANCITFTKLSMPDRQKIVESQNLCKQCLKMHSGECKNFPCTICSGKHHETLHRESPSSSRMKSVVNTAPATTNI